MADREREKNRMYEEHPFGMRSVLEQLEPVKKYRNERVLIAGCGAGARVFDLCFYGADVMAVDQSMNAIEFIRSQCDELDIDPPELVMADLVDVDLPAEEFDYVLCYGVLHHTTAPESILRNLKGALKPEGTLQILLYHTNSLARLEKRVVEQLSRIFRLSDVLPKSFKQRVRWWDRYENPLWETYTRAEAKALVEDAGLVVSDLWLANTPFGPLTTWLIPPVLRVPLKGLLHEYKWYIRINAVTEYSKSE